MDAIFACRQSKHDLVDNKVLAFELDLGLSELPLMKIAMSVINIALRQIAISLGF